MLSSARNAPDQGFRLPLTLITDVLTSPYQEPNEVSQSNMAAADSVSFWMNDMVPLKSKGVALGGAATTSAPTGLQWIQDFQNDCTQQGNSAADCAMAYVALLPLSCASPDETSGSSRSIGTTLRRPTSNRTWRTSTSRPGWTSGSPSMLVKITTGERNAPTRMVSLPSVIRTVFVFTMTYSLELAPVHGIVVRRAGLRTPLLTFR